MPTTLGLTPQMPNGLAPPGWQHQHQNENNGNKYAMASSPVYQETTSGPLSRSSMAPQFLVSNPYTAPPPMPSLATSQFDSFQFGSSYGQTHPSVASGQPVSEMARSQHQNQLQLQATTHILEPERREDPTSSRFKSSVKRTKPTRRLLPHHGKRAEPIKVEEAVYEDDPSTEDGNKGEFFTPIDNLMRLHQSKEAKAPKPLEEVAEALKMEPTSPEIIDASEAGAFPKQHHCMVEGCGMKFRQRSHLDIHMRVHTGERPYVCPVPICRRRFTQSVNLRNHLRRHTGEKPYACRMCNKRFPQRGNLNAHEKIHTRTEGFLCDLDGCKKEFSNKGNAKYHQNKHHGRYIQRIMAKFAQVSSLDALPDDDDKRAWLHITSLHKNSNKGVKGRGRGCTVKRYSNVRCASGDKTIIASDGISTTTGINDSGSSCSSAKSVPSPYLTPSPSPSSTSCSSAEATFSSPTASHHHYTPSGYISAQPAQQPQPQQQQHQHHKQQIPMVLHPPMIFREDIRNPFSSMLHIDQHVNYHHQHHQHLSGYGAIPVTTGAPSAPAPITTGASAGGIYGDDILFRDRIY